MTDTDEIARLRALWCEEKSKAMTFHAEVERLRAEVAALKPQSNANNSAPIPLKEWVMEVFTHLCHSPHTPDEWKRHLDKKTIALLNAIEQGKEGQR
jgi:hypothetical protein